MYNIRMNSDNNPNPQSPSNVRQVLEQARSFAQQGQYRQARALLDAVRDHPIAQKWLTQIDGSISNEEIEFDFPEPIVVASTEIPSPMSTPTAATYRQLYADITQNGLVTLLFGGAMIVLGMVMIVNFVALSWIDSRDASLWTPGVQGVSRTAAQIWYGDNRGAFSTLDLEKDSQGASGFGSVRMIDRTLILIPFGAIYLILLSLRFLIFPKRSQKSLRVLAVISAMLFVFPYIWEAFSTFQWQNYLTSVPPERIFGPYGEGLRATFGNQALSELAGEFLALLLYDTYEQKILGAIAFILSVLMLGGALAKPYRDFDTNPRKPNPQELNPQE